MISYIKDEITIIEYVLGSMLCFLHVIYLIVFNYLLKIKNYYKLDVLSFFFEINKLKKIKIIVISNDRIDFFLFCNVI